MKALLKHVANKYVLIVDERPFEDEIGFDIIGNRIIPLHETEGNWWDLWRIIAAENLDGVKGIALIVDDTLITDKSLIHDLLNEVSFEEVEVTEEDNYWVVRL